MDVAQRFRELAASLRAVETGNPKQGDAYVARDSVCAAKLVQAAVESGDLALDLPSGWKWPSGHAPHHDGAIWGLTWQMLCRVVASQYPEAVSRDVGAVEVVGRTESGGVVVVESRMAPDEWKRRACEYARVCDILGELTGAATEPLTDSQQEVFDYIRDNGPVTGKEIVNALGGEQSTLTKHIIPALKPRGVRNRRGAGYYLKSGQCGA